MLQNIYCPEPFYMVAVNLRQQCARNILFQPTVPTRIYTSSCISYKALTESHLQIPELPTEHINPYTA